jgi:hypothetical protein
MLAITRVVAFLIEIELSAALPHSPVFCILVTRVPQFSDSKSVKSHHSGSILADDTDFVADQQDRDGILNRCEMGGKENVHARSKFRNLVRAR